jgi:DNA-directed RNA polymerase specialized sigma subunit
MREREKHAPRRRQAARQDQRLRFQEDLIQREIAARVGLSQMHVSRILRDAVRRMLRDAVRTLSA